MSSSDEYEEIYRRIQRSAGIDGIPRLLALINALELSDYDKRLELLSDIGYTPTNFDVWKNLEVLSQCEWTNLLIGVEPMKPDVPFPNPDDFNVLISSVNVWPVFHRLIHDKLLNVTAEMTRPAIMKKGKEAFSNDSYRKADFIRATESLGLPIPAELYESIGSTSSEIEAEADEQRWIFRRLASNQWEIGKEGATKRLRGVLGFHDLMFAIQNRGKDIELETMVGMHANSLPDFGVDEEIDETTRVQVRKAIADLQENIESAKSANKFDLVDQYEADKAKYENYLRSSTKPGGMARALDKGNPKKKLAVTLRNRQFTVKKNLDAAGLSTIASHFVRHYKVTDYSVSYCPLPDSNIDWKLSY